MSHAGDTVRAYIGTYTSKGSEGIYVLELDRDAGTVTEARVAAKQKDPSFAAIHPNGKFLYAVSEVDATDGKKGGGVSAYKIDAATGNLELLNGEITGGGAPCHLIVDPTGKNLLIANYSGGSVACLPINTDGSLKPTSSFVQHVGTSVDKGRQEAPHAHSINVDPTGDYAVVADLGLDKVLVYKFDSDHGQLVPNEPPSTSTKAGGGPRHFAFHPSGKYAYTNLEMTSEVTAFQVQSGCVLAGIQTLSTLPDGQPVPGNSTAETQVHPSGKFVYVSNRGHNSLAIYTVDPKTGKLTHVGNQSTEGGVPRNFCIDPSGKYILAANQETDTVVVLKIDQETGKLTPTGSRAKVPTPVCVKFWTAG
jgi:6-phosphogluconolactonase